MSCSAKPNATCHTERRPELSRCLVVAGRSFLGRHVVPRLRHSGCEVLVTARRAGPDVFRVCDLLNPGDLEGLLADSRPDWVLSLAGVPRHDPDAAGHLHIEGTRNLLQAVIRERPQARLLLVGSAAEYGRVGGWQLPIDEDCPAGPRSGFGISKLAQTRIAQDEASRWGLDIVSLRPFNILGPGQPGHYLAGALIRRLAALPEGGAHQVLPVASGNSTRDFVDVRDVAEAVVGVVQRLPPRPGGVRIFNVCTGRETSVRELAQQLCVLAGGCDLIDVDAPSSGEIDRSCGDPRKLGEAIGWRPAIDWQDSLRDAWIENGGRSGAEKCVRPAAQGAS